MLPGRTSLRLLLLVLIYLLYLILGAAIFSAIEGPVERQISNELLTYKQKFLHKHSQCMTEDDLNSLLELVIDANNKGVSAQRNVSTGSNWSFGQAIFFATSVLTTIGYGHVTPLSDGGKLFCVIFATLGIPLTLILFTALVERLLLVTNLLLEALLVRYGHLYRTLHIRLMHVSILFSLLLVLVFLLPATIFTILERNWNFLDSFYYCFISMTTIGLGDYIPGDDYKQPLRPLYKIFTAVYLVVGLMLMMLLLANIYDIPELNIGSHFYMNRGEGSSVSPQSLSGEAQEPGEGEKKKLQGARGEKGYGGTEEGARKGGKSRGSKAEDQESLVDE